jgi:hypothetical protein
VTKLKMLEIRGSDGCEDVRSGLPGYKAVQTY